MGRNLVWITLAVVLLVPLSQAEAGRVFRRPMQTESAFTIDTGGVELGLGFFFGHDMRPVDISLTPPARGRSRDGDLWLLPAIGVAVGLAERVELQLDYDLRLFNPERGDSEFGSGDVRAFTKIRLLDERKYSPALGLRLGFKIPSADDKKGLGTDEADVLISLLFTKKIGPLFANLNLGATILGDPNTNRSQEDVFIWAFSLVYPVSQRVTFLAEAFGHPATARPGANDFAEFRFGTSIRLTDFLSWDFAGITSIGPASPNWGATTGLTFYFKPF